MTQWPGHDAEGDTPERFADKIYTDSADSTRKDYLRNHALFTGLLCLGTAIAFHHIHDFPFDKAVIPVLSVSAAAYFTFFIFFARFAADPQRAIMSLSLMGVGTLAFLTHLTGGIVSPLNSLYFAILVSEVAYGVTFSTTIYASVASYLIVVLGEASGFFEAKYALAKTLYESPVLLAAVVVPVTCHMVVTGRIGKIILMKLRAEVEDENRKKQVILKRFSELDAYSHIGLLAHRIAHDLRGPLASISGYVEMERWSPDKSDEEKAVLSDLAETVVAMTDALNSITRFGRATDGKREKIKMREFFRNLVAMLAFYTDAQRIQFRQNYPDAGDISVTALRQDLQQAYFNILKNAVEAVKDNSGDKIIEISMRQSAGMLEVGVTNNGRTIPEEILSKIFQKAVTGKSDGTGVGLLITHDLLMKNDISIEVRNMDGVGVLVSTRMPLAE